MNHLHILQLEEWEMCFEGWWEKSHGSWILDKLQPEKKKKYIWLLHIRFDIIGNLEKNLYSSPSFSEDKDAFHSFPT